MPAPVTQKPLLGKLRLTCHIVVETGLHIGGGGENLDIGGLDKPVIRDPLTRQPYLPGSSIKGKLRSILERFLNEPLNRVSRIGEVNLYRHECDTIEPWFSAVGETQSTPHVGAEDCPICRVFGSTGVDCRVQSDRELKKVKGSNKPARLIVRDCHLVPESAEKLKKIDTGLYMTEWKFENTIDRVTAAANPRQFERVPAQSQFQFELVYTVEDVVHAEEDLKNIAIALAILEDDALGGHGSRGYGKVRFQNFQLHYHDVQQYLRVASGARTVQEPIELSNTAQLLANFSQVRNLLSGS